MVKYAVAILGAGNIGTALASGLIKSGQYKIDEIILTDKRSPRLEVLGKRGFIVTEDNAEAAKNAGTVVFAVKPQQFGSLCDEIHGVSFREKIILSTITGITHNDIEAIFGAVPNVRIMPNIALEICESMTCLSFSSTKPSDEKKILSMLDRMGSTLVIREDLMSAATVIGACGIAFCLRFMRAMSQGGIEIGFNSEISQIITAQTMKGAAGIILATSNHPESEIDKVTTPQGITISGLNDMEHQGMSSAVIHGIITSFKKIGEMYSK